MSASPQNAGLSLGGGYVLDTLSHVLTQNGSAMPLSPLGSRLLQLLASQPGAVVERAEIIEVLWKGDWLVGDPALSRLVSELRRDTGDDAKNPSLIQTVPRRGYRLVTHVGQALPEAMAVATPSEQSWARAWALANRSLLILIGGTALLLALAVLARLFR